MFPLLFFAGKQIYQKRRDYLKFGKAFSNKRFFDPLDFISLEYFYLATDKLSVLRMVQFIFLPFDCYCLVVANSKRYFISINIRTWSLCIELWCWDQNPHLNGITFRLLLRHEPTHQMVLWMKSSMIERAHAYIQVVIVYSIYIYTY